MALTPNGINYICQKYGNSSECVVSINGGLRFDFIDPDNGQTFTNQTGATSDVIWMIINDLMSSITMKNPSRPVILNPKEALTLANGTEPTNTDCETLDSHDEASSDQWCFVSNSARISCTNCTTTAYDFGTRVINSPSTEKQFTIANDGFGDATVAATLTGTNATDFQISTALVSPIPEGYGHFVGVKFNPKSSGIKNATLHISCSNCETGYTTVDQKVTGTGGGGTNCTNPAGVDGTILDCGIAPLDTTHRWKCNNGSWVDQGYNATCLTADCINPNGPIGSEACIDGYMNTCSTDKVWVPNVPTETCLLCSSYLTEPTCKAGGCFWYSDLPFIGTPYCHKDKEDPTKKYLIYGGIALVAIGIVVFLVKRGGGSQPTYYYPPQSNQTSEKRKK